MKSIRIGVLCACGATALAVLSPAPAHARQAVAVLAFGGPGGERMREQLIAEIEDRFDVVDGAELLVACDELGISLSRGANLAKAARHVGASAVVGGAVAKGALNLAVYSARNGEPLGTGSVRVKRRMSRANLQQAMEIIEDAVRKAPAVAGKTRPSRSGEAGGAAATASPPQGGTYAGGASAASGNLKFEPDVVSTSDGRPAGGNAAKAAASKEENPLSEVPKYGTSPNGTTALEADEPKKADTHGTPRIEASLRFGLWMRSLEMNDTADTPRKPPKYGSGAAFAVGFGARVRPLAFFLDNALKSIYSRLTYQTMVGLESRDKTGTATPGNEPVLSTSLSSLNWEVVGFDWNIMNSLESVHLEAGIGFGLMNFSIDWPATSSRPLPDASYSYFLSSLGVMWPIWKMVKVSLRVDYRAVTDAGEIATSDSSKAAELRWYGPASVGGIGGTLGVSATFWGFIAGFEYNYTRYFYSFEEAASRKAICAKPAVTANEICLPWAGGALDQLHGLMLNVGYSL